jgi:hypothetical protein
MPTANMGADSALFRAIHEGEMTQAIVGCL